MVFTCTSFNKYTKDKNSLPYYHSSQMLSYPNFPITESEILFAVSCDWFIAICHPLQCTSILNNTQVIKIGSGVFMRGFIFICPNIASLLVFLLQIPCSLSPILPISGCYQTSHVLTLPSVTCILLWQYFL